MRIRIFAKNDSDGGTEITYRSKASGRVLGSKSTPNTYGGQRDHDGRGSAEKRAVTEMRNR